MGKEFINTKKYLKSESARFLDKVGSPEDVEILLIEDNLPTIRLMESYFEAKGHNCKGVVAGVSGLYLLRNFLKPKVVLINIILPDMTGYDVCKIIKSDPDLKSIPVIFFTSLPASEVKKRLEDTKADGYIIKPFDFSDFDIIFSLLGTPIQRKEYKINEFLVLKMDEGNTYIYVKGQEFLQCRRLAITKATELYEKHLYQNKMVEGQFARIVGDKIHDITPEQEFWGHCSNLQAWYEHNYDTRLLYSTLAFPLLKALVDAGDPDAKKVFKKEIADCFESGYLNTIISIFSAKLLDYFNPEEKKHFNQQNIPVILKHLEYPSVFSYIFKERLLDYFNPEEKKHFIQQNIPVILKFIEKPHLLPYILPYIFKERLLDYLNPEERKHLVQQNFYFFLKYKEKISKHYPNMFPSLINE